jgi:hypothetical protein
MIGSVLHIMYSLLHCGEHLKLGKIMLNILHFEHGEKRNSKSFFRNSSHISQFRRLESWQDVKNIRFAVATPALERALYKVCLSVLKCVMGDGVEQT